jgi:hypothetical protein
MTMAMWRRLECRRCGITLNPENKYGTAHGGICKECYNALLRERDPKKRHDYWVKYKAQNRERLAEIAQRSKSKLKREVISHYSGGSMACARCGYSDIRALGLDHINGDGARQRKLGSAGNGFYFWLRTNRYPEGFQVLCMNCNWLKREENSELTHKRLGG